MYERRIPFIMRMLTSLAERGDFDLNYDGPTGDVGQITFPNGKTHYVTRTDLRVNLTGPHDLAGSKLGTDYFLARAGMPVIDARLFYSPSFVDQYGLTPHTHQEMVAYATELGYPVVVKPNNGTHGKFFTKVSTNRELKRAVAGTFREYSKVLIQRYVKASDYRIVVYRGKAYFAYQRTPLTITGDGSRSIRDFITELQEKAIAEHRSFKIEVASVEMVLKRIGRKLSYVPHEGESVVLLDNANVTSGGSAIDVTEVIHPEYLNFAIRAAEVLNLTLAGVDLLIQGKVNEAPVDGTWFVLEVNASPGFEGFAHSSSLAYERVEGLVTEVLSDIGHS